MTARMLLLIFAVLEGILISLCASCEAPKIEADLLGGSTEALAERNIDLGPGLILDGRDAWLIGNVASEQAKTEAELAVRSVWGVRVVHNQLAVGAATSAAPAPAASAPMPTTTEVQRSIDDLIAGRVVEFESGSDRLTENGRTLVDELAELLERFPDARIEIAGHTDGQGRAQANLELSQRRAEAVRSRMISRGIAESRLTARGYGEERPIADNETAEGRFKNRRVELVVQ